MEGGKPKHGWLVETEGRKELWMSFAEADYPDIVKDHCVVTWRVGDCNLVISVPHAGVLGQDTAPAGNLICQSGHTIETRKGTLQYPIKTYARDAVTDVIAKGLRTQLAGEGLLPHVVECHVHRSKVECNRNMVEIAVATQGKEAETIHRIYHSWISQALQLGVTEGRGSSALLLDLHGHGHPHDCVELGYRLSSDLLNAINQDQDTLPRTWRSIVTSASRHEFTLRHLLRRQFGSSEEAVREAVIGEHSFGGCLSAALTERPAVADVVVLPSEAKPCPGKLGYYTGGHTTREHCKRGRVDTLQVELPLSMRTGAQERMEAGTGALAAALLAFHRLHYSAQPQHRPSPAINDGEEELSSSDEEPILPNATAPILSAPPPPGPPPPPPPPPVAAPSTVQADGVGHMAMMAKSKMHAELVRKANLRMAVDTPQEAEEPQEPREAICSGTQQPPVPGAPPPPPPPPPPPMPSLPASRPDTSDGISHMTAMSKSQMHKELVAKSKFRESPADSAPSAASADPAAVAGATTAEVEETASEKKVRERKKIVQDILNKEEEACHTSNLRKLNEEKRREFFTPSTIQPSEEEGTPAVEDKAELACEATPLQCEESVREEEGENTPAPHVKKTCNIL